MKSGFIFAAPLASLATLLLVVITAPEWSTPRPIPDNTTHVPDTMVLVQFPSYTNYMAVLKSLTPSEEKSLFALMDMNESVVIHEYHTSDSTNLHVMFDVSNTPANSMPTVSFSTNQEDFL